MRPKLTDLLDVAADAARAAGRRTLDFFNTRLEVDLKADQSPVTIADRESEKILRQRILKAFPDHGILGEEEGDTPGADHRYRWIIDPLDGTKSFIRGVPLYGVLVGVEVDGVAAVGAVYLPATDELITAAIGHGATLNGKSIRVSNTTTLENATLLTTNVPRCLAKSDAFPNLMNRVQLVAGWGDAYGHVMVATGRADLMIDPKMSPWDCAAIVPIITEAGGRFTSWTGEPTIWAPDAVSSNSILHPQALSALGETCAIRA